MMTFRPGEVARLVDRHRSRIDSLVVPPAVVVLSNYCFAMLMMCRVQDGLVAARQAMEMALRLDDDSKCIRAGGSDDGSCIAAEGDPDNIQRQVQLGLQEGDHTNDGYLRGWIYLAAAWSYLELGLFNRARALALELQARGRIRGDPRPAAMGLWVLGWADVTDENFTDAFEHGSECIRVSLTPFDREIGTQVKGGRSYWARSDCRESGNCFRSIAERAIANEFMYCRVGTDGPVGLGNGAAGRFLGRRPVSRKRYKVSRQYRLPERGRLMRLMLAQVYIEMISAKAKTAVMTSSESIFHF